MRDADIEKQEKDYSCGAASLATILRHFYNIDTDESRVLDKVPNLDGDLSASFAELSIGARKFGFKAVSVDASFDRLKQLKIPALAYVKHEGQDHFTVVRGVDKQSNRVWLADPSWGNRIFNRHQFLQMWSTEEQGIGKLLLLAPQSSISSIQWSFVSSPENRLRLATELLRQQATRF